MQEHSACNDEYSVRISWTNIGALGYSGTIQLIDKSENKKYWVSDSVPASCKWVSDYEFEINGKQKYSRAFHVKDFINK